MVKKIKSWLNILFLTIILIIPGLVFATSTTSIVNPGASPIIRLNNAAKDSGPYTEYADQFTLAKTLSLVINVALSILGVIFIILVILAGFKWMTAQGNEAKVTEATDSLTRAVIGLVLVISAYAIWTFIKTVLIKAL